MQKHNRITNFKGMFFLIVLICAVLLIVACLVPLKRKVSGEYSAAVLTFSAREQVGTAKVRFEGTYTQYLLSPIFQDRFVGEFYVEGEPVTERCGEKAVIDFHRGGFQRTGILHCFNEEKNRLEFVGEISQRTPLQSGYLILREALTEGGNDQILVFPEDDSKALLELQKRFKQYE